MKGGVHKARMEESEEKKESVPSGKDDSKKEDPKKADPINIPEAKERGIGSEEKKRIGISEEKSESKKEERKMFKATCYECGKETEVPFKPDEDREVYCKECYQKRKPKRRFNNRLNRRRDGGRFRKDKGFFRRERQMFKTICARCGKEAKVPFKPNGKKPVLCSDCFRQNRN